MEKDILVAKYGSTSVVNGSGMDIHRIAKYCDNLQDIQDSYSPVIVSSGAVATGRVLWGELNGDAIEPGKQALAMMGMGRAFTAWQDELGLRGISAGQLPVTHREIDDYHEGPTMLDALKDCIDYGVWPVINENDALSIEELAKLKYGGDNDGLSSHISIILGAKALFLMTNKGGIFDEEGKEIKRVYAEQRQNIFELASHRGHNSKKGTGGLLTKFDSAIKAADSDVLAFIARADASFEDILNNQTGTQVLAKTA